MQKETQYSVSNQGLDREAPGACNVVKFDSIRFAVPMHCQSNTFTVSRNTVNAYSIARALTEKEFAIHLLIKHGLFDES